MKSVAPTPQFTPGEGSREIATQRGIRKAARSFESFFLSKMLESMRRTVPKEGLVGRGFADDVYTGFLDQALAEEMSAAGGIGLGETLARQFGAEKAYGVSSEASPATVAAVQKVREGIGLHKERPISPIRSPYLGGRFGPRFSLRQNRWKFHRGIDLAAREGTPVKAVLSGRVKVARDVSGYGNAVYLDHGNGLVTRYAHTSKLLVKEGQRVRQGETIALSGNTGISDAPHLHFEVRFNKVAVDPELWLGEEVMLQTAGNYRHLLAKKRRTVKHKTLDSSRPEIRCAKDFFQKSVSGRP